MKSVALILLFLTGLLLAGGAWWIVLHETAPAPLPQATQPATSPATLRLGLIPEQNVFELRQRYDALKSYLSVKLGQPVEYKTVNSYQGILDDFKEKQIDAAFLGSLTAVLAMDRLDTRVLLKTVMPNGMATYTGVVFVRDDSPIRKIEDLTGRTLGLVRTTTGGNLYPFLLLNERRMVNNLRSPNLVWIGSHDEVIRDVAEGRLEAGAVKSTWLDQYETAHPEVHIRRLAVSDPVPNNSLVIRADLADTLGPRLRKILLDMDSDPQGRQTLQAYGAQRFLPCTVEEYHLIYEIVERIGPVWDSLGISGPPPRRPGKNATTQPAQP